MNNECVLNTKIRENNNILRRDYALATAYSKCLMDIENSQAVLDFRKRVRDDVKSKIDLASNSIDTLSKLIEKTDSEIKRVKRDITHCTGKLDSLQNHILFMACSPSDEDQSVVFQKNLTISLLNKLKYFEVCRSVETENNSSHRTQFENFHDEKWRQFRME